MPFSRLLLLATLILTAVLFVPVRGQEKPPTSSAHKFDEFGDIQISDKKARMDNFVVQLQQDPSVKGYIIVYHSRRDRPGLSVRLLDQMRRYLLYNRGLTSDRIVTIDGGPAMNLVQEFWIVPPGTTPEIRSDAYTTVVEDRTVARVYDEYFFDLDDSHLTDGDLMGDSLPGFAAALHREPESLAYVIAYPQCQRNGRRTNCDPKGSAARMLHGVRIELTKTHNLPASRLRLVNGGYRRQRAVELWIVPRGEHAPIATPNAYPPRRSARRNTNHSLSPAVQTLIPAPTRSGLVASVSLTPQPISPRKFDEFGELQPSDKKARLDNYIIELNGNPEAQGVVIVYRSKRDPFGFSARLLRFVKHYMIDVRGFSAERVILIDGGVNSPVNNVWHEFWITPLGVDPRHFLRTDSASPVDLTSAREFDEYYYSAPGEFDETEGDSLPEFAEVLRQEPNTLAYVIVYSQYYVERDPRSVFRDRPGTATQKMNRIRADLRVKHGIYGSRIRIINGGYRRQRAIELWIVPPGEHPPVATPNSFPPRRKAKRHHPSAAAGRTNDAQPNRAHAAAPDLDSVPISAVPGARKFDEFGIMEVTAMRQRLDRFATELANQSSDEGTVVFYRGKTDLPGLSSRWVEGAVAYLKEVKGVEHLKLMGLAPGAVARPVMELWIRPSMVAVELRDHVDEGSLPDPRRARKFDEYYYDLADDGDAEADAR